MEQSLFHAASNLLLTERILQQVFMLDEGMLDTRTSKNTPGYWLFT